MFEELNNEIVRLMLDLSRESIENIEELRFRLKETSLNDLFNLCLEHELDGVVASHIIENSICDLPGYWMDKYRKERKHLSFLKSKASEICDQLAAHGIKMVVLKNGGIMCDMVRDEAACPMEDIDSLVKKSDFLKAHDILIESGLTFKFRSEFEKEEIQSAYRDGSTEYYLETPNGKRMWFELAWRAVAGRWIRQDLEPDTDLLIDHSYCADNTKVGILSPEDNLLQVCVHTAKHSYVRAPGLRLHLDVERILAHKKIDWQTFEKKVEKVHVKTAVYFSLYLAKLLFSSPVPDEILAHLRPSSLKEKRILGLLNQAGLLYPNKSKFTKMQFLCFQTSLYDSKKDMMRVLYPGKAWMMERYNLKSSWNIPGVIVKRGLDLLGIRKKA